jgi:hypothetical protein
VHAISFYIYFQARDGVKLAKINLFIAKTAQASSGKFDSVSRAKYPFHSCPYFTTKRGLATGKKEKIDRRFRAVDFFHFFLYF